MKLPDRFMFVDDDPINNMICDAIVRKLYEKMDTKLFVVPETALEYIEREYGEAGNSQGISTLLFLDLNMPSMDGWFFLEEFINLDESIKEQFTIFILSSSVNESDMVHAASHPLLSGYISKPMSKGTLKKLFNDDDL